jgi:hypothetical protein
MPILRRSAWCVLLIVWSGAACAGPEEEALPDVQVEYELATAQSIAWNEQLRYDTALANPTNLFLLGDGRVLVDDRADSEAALKIVDLGTGTVRATTRIGEGPGEVSYNGYKYAWPLPDNRIYLWDFGAQRGTIFSSELEPLAQVRSPARGMGVLFPLSDDVMLWSDQFSRSTFADLYAWNSTTNTVSEAPFNTVPYSAHAELEPITRNPLLKQGPLRGVPGSVWIRFDYASAIAYINRDGLRYVQHEPASIAFPRQQQSGTLEAPDAAEHPVATLDIASDDRYVYVLHKGETFGAGRIRQLLAMARGRLEVMIEEFESSRTVLVYERDTGAYVETLTLPLHARRIGVDNDSFYILTIDDLPPTIIAYDRPL